jgi:hypothetical protein
MSVNTEVDVFVLWNLIMTITAIITESYIWNTYCLFNSYVQTVENFDIYKNTAVCDIIWHELLAKNILKVILSVDLTFIDNILHIHYLLMNFAVLRLNTVGIKGDISRVKDLKVPLVR